MSAKNKAECCEICGLPVKRMVYGHDYDESRYHPNQSGDCVARLLSLIELAAETYRQPEDVAWNATSEFVEYLKALRKDAEKWGAK